MRLELMIHPNAMDGVLAYLLSPRQRTSAPMRGPGRFVLQGGLNDACDLFALEGRLPSTAGRNLPNATDALG